MLLSHSVFPWGFVAGALMTCSHLFDTIPEFAQGCPPVGPKHSPPQGFLSALVFVQAGNTGELLPLEAGLADGGCRITAQLLPPQAGLFRGESVLSPRVPGGIQL